MARVDAAAGAPTVFMQPSPLSHAPSSTTIPARKSGSNALRDISTGIVGGIVSKFVEYPFDTIKVRLQSQSHLYAGPVDCFKKSLARDGVAGFYRGLSAPVAGAAAENASLFWSYEVAKDVLKRDVWQVDEEDLPLTAKAMAGAVSGAVTSLILTPIELVKCRMQVPLQSTVDPTLGASPRLAAKTPSPLAVIGSVYRSSGLKGFYSGHLGTFLRETGGTAAWFGGYEAALLYFKRQQAAVRHQPISDVSLPLSLELLSGAIAGVSYNFLFYPADTIKSNIQTQDITPGTRASFLGVGREIWRTQGVRGLYRGCGLTVARSVPSSALIFATVENLKKMWPKTRADIDSA
jgi:mitochondrial ornithine carrier protein